MDRTELGVWDSLVNFPTEKWNSISAAVEQAYETGEVFPPRDCLFAALQATPPEQLRCVILGQDPYHEPGQAHGLSFSVKKGTAIPKSLQNIYRELQDDVGCTIPNHGNLEAWAEQGVLLLNSILTVEAHKAGSHKKFGWEAFTDSVIEATNLLHQPIAFILWGNFAIKKEQLIHTDAPRLILKSVHPSPLSAYRGFFGSRPFSQVNAFLTSHDAQTVDWCIPE